jgi:hypothetical protein
MTKVIIKYFLLRKSAEMYISKTFDFNSNTNFYSLEKINFFIWKLIIKNIEPCSISL